MLADKTLKTDLRDTLLTKCAQGTGNVEKALAGRHAHPMKTRMNEGALELNTGLGISRLAVVYGYAMGVPHTFRSAHPLLGLSAPVTLGSDWLLGKSP
jgi:hypothetical protein